MIGPYETPECLNVVFDDQGSAATRPGSETFNTAIVGSAPFDHAVSYNQTLFVWSGGAMWKNSGPSGTSFTMITASSGRFASGAKVGTAIYQNLLFASDGTNGPWKYSGGENFYNMGIDTPSAPTGASNGAGSIATGTYYYAISFVNSQVVEGEIGSSSAAVVLTNSSTVRVNSIPVGSSLAGVAQRFVYRAEAASGPFRKVGEINDNTTATFDDNVANGDEGKLPIEDGTKPEAFHTITLHNERLFFNKGSDRSLLRYTDFENPFVAAVENEEPINYGDGENIIAIGSQDNFVTIFKSNRTFAIATVDPADDLTWQKDEVPANIGIVGQNAFDRYDNGLLFVGKQNNKLTGLHFLSGISVAQSTDGRLRTLSISKKIEFDLLNEIADADTEDIAVKVYKNRLYLAYTRASEGSVNNRIFWLDLSRVGTDGQPGSWAPWRGINAQCFVIHSGGLFSGDSTSTGYMRHLDIATYGDSGAAINSFIWTKEIGGEKEGELDSYIKDLRELYVWHQKIGSYNMNVRLRVDGDTTDGPAFPIDLTATGSTWGNMIWGVDPWGGARTDSEVRIPIGRMLGKRFQVRFDNQNTINQGFKVHRVELGFNLRRRR